MNDDTFTPEEVQLLTPVEESTPDPPVTEDDDEESRAELAMIRKYGKIDGPLDIDGRPGNMIDDTGCRRLAAMVISVAMRDFVRRKPSRPRRFRESDRFTHEQNVSEWRRLRDSGRDFLLGQNGHDTIRGHWCAILDIEPSRLESAVSDRQVRDRVIRQLTPNFAGGRG